MERLTTISPTQTTNGALLEKLNSVGCISRLLQPLDAGLHTNVPSYEKDDGNIV